MDLLKIGSIIGKIEGLISSIDSGYLETKKNETNYNVKRQSIKLINELKKELNS